LIPPAAFCILRFSIVRRKLVICLLLAALTLAAFWPVGRLGFSIYDDEDYVVHNPHVVAGLTTGAIGWAFTSMDTDGWVPMTWLSHMMDCQWFGLNAGAHHWMNLGIHVANVLMLFLALVGLVEGGRRNFEYRISNNEYRMKGEKDPAPLVPLPSEGRGKDGGGRAGGTVWCCALAAALFAVHPLRVESVAWIAERKDVLSGLFFMLTLLCYVKGFTIHGSGFRVYYWLAVVFFALGLMSKGMLVTLPFVLLLLDYWPLGRNSGFNAWTLQRLVVEKLPFFALAVAACVVTFVSQRAGGSVVSLHGMPLGWRIENALWSSLAYLGKTVWPENLAVCYPIRRIAWWEALSAALALTSLTTLCLWRARRRPYLLVGWFWFLIMLAPVIGLVQIGKQAMADRYTYLPSIGLCLIAAGGMAELASRSKPWRAAMILLAIGLVLACVPATWRQLGFWQDDVKLFSHAIEVRQADNYEGYLFLGNALVRAGRLDAAIQNYQASLQIDPDEMSHQEEAHYNVGAVLAAQKKFQEAAVHFAAALQLDPNNADAHAGLGRVLAAQKEYAEAEAEYTKALALKQALALKPDDPAITKALRAATLMAQSEIALTNYLEVLKTNPTAEIHAAVSAILILQGNPQGAVEHYQAGLRLQPDSPEILNNLAWLLSTCADARIRNGAQAVNYAKRACELTHDRQVTAIGTLAAAYAEAGQFDEAVATAQKACALAEQNGQPQLLQKNQELLELYQAHQAYHETANSP
jgi:tetratricopeptide (TPR) repeat protein